MPPLLIAVSDLHLSPGFAQQASRQLAALLLKLRPQELVLLGDIFDLSQLSPEELPEEFIRATLLRHSELRAALGQLAEGEFRLSYVLGNHDAALREKLGDEELAALWGLPAPQQFQLIPWFCLRGELFFEHGNQYDPDNAYSHPLAAHDPRSEPLGVALTRRFVARQRAHSFAHASDTTPLGGLYAAFRRYGLRGPSLVYHYFKQAFLLLLETQTLAFLRQQEARQGEAREAAYAKRQGLSPEQLEVVRQLAAPCRHDAFSRLFLRLYFDRISLALGSGVALLQLGCGQELHLYGPLMLGLLLALALRVRLGPNYAEALRQGVDSAARTLHAQLPARTVVFGHTHQSHSEAGYINLGSFTYDTEARPYLLCREGEEAELCYWRSSPQERG